MLVQIFVCAGTDICLCWYRHLCVLIIMMVVFARPTADSVKD